MSEDTTTPQVLEALTRSRRLAKRHQLLALVGKRTSRLTAIGDTLAGVLILILVAPRFTAWSWPAFLLALLVVTFYQWRLSRLETRLDALADWIDADQAEMNASRVDE